jgi:hypothetical protein
MDATGAAAVGILIIVCIFWWDWNRDKEHRKLVECPRCTKTNLSGQLACANCHNSTVYLESRKTPDRKRVYFAATWRAMDNDGSRFARSAVAT